MPVAGYMYRMRKVHGVSSHREAYLKVDYIVLGRSDVRIYKLVQVHCNESYSITCMS